jgi:cephalosporin-C deacetylase
MLAQAAGFYEIQTPTYRALIGADGNLHSLSVADTELLDDQVAISLGSFFYADGPRKLGSVERPEESVLEATDGTYSIRYRFLANNIRVTLTNKAARPVPYFVVLSPAITIVSTGKGEAAAVPANERWGAAQFQTESGAYLELSGGTRTWGPWLGRQVWEVSQVAPGADVEIVFHVGTGARPRATLSQLVGVRARLSSDTGLVSANSPIELVVSLDNRSDQSVRGNLSVELTATRGDVVIYSTSSFELAPKRASQQTFRWQVQSPDFYRANVTALSGGREIAAARAAAGYRVAEMRPDVPRPGNFHDFWQRLVAEAGAQTPGFYMRRDERLSRRGLEVWVVQYDSIGGKTIHGLFATPASARGLPAILYLPGYGARPVEAPVVLATHGWVVLAIDVRGNRIDRARPRAFEDYCTEGIESPDNYVYREIVGHALRGLSFLASREETDPSRIAVVGVSEGGGVGLILAALSPQVAAVAADAPMLVNFPLSLRAASWPYTELARYLQQHAESRGNVLQTLSYFDVANFAPDIHCPVLLSTGFLDRVSLPGAVFGLYNVLPGSKDIRSFPQAGHEGGGEDLWTYKLDWLAEKLGPSAR